MSNTDFEIDEPEIEQPEAEVDPVEASTEADEEIDEQPEESEVDEEPAPRRSRRDARIETLLSRAEEERARAERLDREIQELRAQSRRPVQEDPALEAERLALMSPEDRAQYKIDKALSKNAREMAEFQFRIEDRADRDLFLSKAQTDPLYAKMAPKVEAALTDLRRQGQNIERERLFTYLVGQEALASRGKRAATAARKGSENVERQRAPSTRVRGEVRTERRASGDTPAKRLEGVPI